MLPSGTVTFLFTDVAGSTARWEAEPDRMRAALLEHNAILEGVSGEFGGVVFKTVGDAYCVAFASAEDAASAAMAAQQRLGDAVDPLPVRMGLHTAAIQPTGGDYFGPPLNRVARIMAAANPRQILLSDATRALLPAGFPLKDLGQHTLRDLLEPARIWQLGAGDLGGVRGISAVRNNLPLQATSFVGRDEELRQLQAMLDRSRLLTLTGTGGTGKSRLSLQFAAENMDRFPDGVWFVELAALPEREDVLRAVAAAVSAPEVIGSLHDRLVMYLAGKRCLLILDNCEHVLEVASSVAEALLSACASITILTTSREPLGARGEVAYRVPSLPTPDPARRPGLEDLERFGSTALFVDRLATVAPSYHLQEAEALTIAKICTRLDGIPLAIELAAARGRAMTLEQIEKRLDDRFRLLTGGSRNALSRQQTLRALIDWSVHLLDDKERRFFVSLSVFGGGWDIEAAEAVCAGAESSIEEWEVLDLLTALVDKSLVVFDRGADRYRLLESVRQYALERLEQDERMFTLRERHSSHFLSYAKEFGSDGIAPDAVPNYKRFSDDYENFRMAVEWLAVKEDGPTRAIAVLADAWPGFHSLGRPDEYLRLLEPFLERPEELDEHSRDMAMLYVGVAHIVGNTERCYEMTLSLQHVLERFPRDVQTRWRAVVGYGIFNSRSLEETLEFATRSVELADPEQPWSAYSFVHHGNVLTCLGRYDEAPKAYEQAFELFERHNDQRGYVANLANLATYHLAAGHPHEAIETAMELNRRSTLNRVYVIVRGVALQAFAHRAIDLGDREAAAILMGGSLGIREASGIAGDPLDRLGETILSDRVRAVVPPEDLDALLERGRRHDWEPFYMELAALSPKEVLDSPQVPLRHLVAG